MSKLSDLSTEEQRLERLYHSEYNKGYCLSNKEKIVAQKKKYRAKNIDNCRAYSRKAYKKKKQNPKYRIHVRMSSGIRISLKGSKGGRKWESLTGYTSNDLKKHLESLFTDGMNWERFLAGEIHIDHIIPVSVFNFTSPEHIDFKRCWALENLQPLWAEDNRKKHDKLLKSFQPSLAL